MRLARRVTLTYATCARTRTLRLMGQFVSVQKDFTRSPIIVSDYHVMIHASDVQILKHANNAKMLMHR